MNQGPRLWTSSLGVSSRVDWGVGMCGVPTQAGCWGTQCCFSWTDWFSKKSRGRRRRIVPYASQGVGTSVAREMTSLCSAQPGASLEQTHIFVLAHILRRPIIVYGVKFYKSFRGETLGYTRFQGEPLPGGRALLTRGPCRAVAVATANWFDSLSSSQVCICLCCGNRVSVGKVQSLWAIQGATSLLWSPWKMMATAAEVLVLT